jgi:NADH-quinone oxidoreductase subunit G
VGGGGQPYHHGDENIIKKRMEAIYREDKAKSRRKSHENEEVIKVYKEFLGEFYGDKAHELLHTHYTAREKI